MGYGTTRSLERVAAAMGQLESAPVRFEAAADIPEGGVLLVPTGAFGAPGVGGDTRSFAGRVSSGV